MRATLKRLVVSIAAMAFMCLAFAQTSTTTTTTDVAPVGPDYVLGPEDVISVSTRDVSEASGDFLIRTDGKITFPIVGEVVAAGLTTKQLEQKLITLLKKELRDPQVTINVKQLRVNRIYVLGAVASAGVRDYRPGWRLTELISASNGLSAPPERLRAIILRKGKSIKIELREVFIDGKEESNIEIQPGDVISIQSDVTIRINVVGAVQKPGMLTILEGQGAIEALAAASAEAPNAALSKAKIIRAGQEIPINLYEAVKNGKAQLNIACKDNDTLLIPTVDERVAVIGQVKNAGAQMMPDGKEWTLSQAISTAGGPAQQAKMDGITILRRGDDGKIQTIPINYKKLQTNDKVSPTGDFVLKDRDVIFVPQSGKPESGQISSVLGLLFWPARLFGLGF